MKTIITLLLVILLTSCSENEPDYTYTYTAKVTYTDSAIDTLTFSRDSFKGNNVYVYLKTEGGTFAGGTSPCLTMSCGFYKKTIACGVRKFEILDLLKVELIDKK